LQKLDVSSNLLRILPEQLSSLKNLNALVLDFNYFSVVPLSILSGLTALEIIRLRFQQRGRDNQVFRIQSSLSPVLHPGLIELGLDQSAEWDPTSRFHLGCALVDVADRTPVPNLTF
jgi:Leucine-rich repeat (LRR) protein